MLKIKVKRHFLSLSRRWLLYLLMLNVIVFNRYYRFHTGTKLLRIKLDALLYSNKDYLRFVFKPVIHNVPSLFLLSFSQSLFERICTRSTAESCCWITDSNNNKKVGAQVGCPFEYTRNHGTKEDPCAITLSPSDIDREMSTRHTQKCMFKMQESSLPIHANENFLCCFRRCGC